MTPPVRAITDGGSVNTSPRPCQPPHTPSVEMLVYSRSSVPRPKIWMLPALSDTDATLPLTAPSKPSQSLLTFVHFGLGCPGDGGEFGAGTTRRDALRLSRARWMGT